MVATQGSLQISPNAQSPSRWPSQFPERRGPNIGGAERLVSLLAGGALSLFGVARRSPGGTVLACGGGLLALRGLTGRSSLYRVLGISTAAATPMDALRFQKSVTVNRSPEEVYQFWHDVTNFPLFMRHIESVTVTGPGRSHWVARFAPGKTIEWDAEVTTDHPYESIAWHSLPGADVTNEGSVRFAPATGNRGTEIHATIRYALLGGLLGGIIARVTNVVPAQQVKDDMHRFKELMEAGEVATTDGQPSGRS